MKQSVMSIKCPTDLHCIITFVTIILEHNINQSQYMLKKESTVTLIYTFIIIFDVKRI
jgi:hypothetical protein